MEKIFNTYYNPLCNYATSFIKDSAAAEDLVQELFIDLWKKDTLNNVDTIEPFLLRCVKNKCIDFLRKKKKTSSIEDLFYLEDTHTNTGSLSEEEIEPLLYYFAAKLPTKTRAIFLMSRDSKLTYQEIAIQQKISVKTVESHMTKALKSMRLLLKEHDFIAFVSYLGLKDLFF